MRVLLSSDESERGIGSLEVLADDQERAMLSCLRGLIGLREAYIRFDQMISCGAEDFDNG